MNTPATVTVRYRLLSRDTRMFGPSISTALDGMSKGVLTSTLATQQCETLAPARRSGQYTGEYKNEE